MTRKSLSNYEHALASFALCNLHARSSNFSIPKHCFLPGKRAAELYKITPRMH